MDVLSAERTLLLRLLSPHEAADPELARLVRTVDWDRLLRLAGASLVPYLGYVISRPPLSDGVPRPVTEAIVRERHRAAFLHLRQWAALHEAVGILDGRGIRSIGLKGIGLAHLYYPDPTLRPMADLDLWLPRDRVAEARDALSAAGWRTPAGGPDRVDPNAAAQKAYLFQPDSRTSIEIHGPPESIADLPPAVLQQAMDRAELVKLGSTTLYVLHREDLLMHLGMHALRHKFGVGPRGVLDIALVVERWARELPWETMAQEYGAQGIDVPMGLSLWIARSLLQAPVPDRFFAALPQVAALSEMRELAIRAALEGTDGQLPGFAEALAEQPTARARMAHIWKRVTSFYRPRAYDPRRAPFRAAIDVARRMGYDIFVKVPRHWRFWRHLVFRRAHVQHAAQAARARARLVELIAQAERSSPVKQAARRR